MPQFLTASSQTPEELATHFSSFWDSFLEWGKSYLPRLVASIVILLVGWYLVKWICRSVKKAMSRGKTDAGVTSFVNSALKICLWIVLLLVVAAQLGLQINSIIAALGAAAVAIALAVKDSLSNVASGILIIITKPFKVGDYIEIEGLEGTVYKIELMFTTMITADNKNVILPNSRVSANNVVNYTAQETRRLDLNFSIGYNDDIQQAKGILQRLIDQDPRVVRREESIIGVFSQDESGVTLALKVWCNTSDYWDLHYALEEQVKLAFDQAGITIPYPQMDVHLVP